MLTPCYIYLKVSEKLKNKNLGEIFAHLKKKKNYAKDNQ